MSSLLFGLLLAAPVNYSVVAWPTEGQLANDCNRLYWHMIATIIRLPSIYGFLALGLIKLRVSI